MFESSNLSMDNLSREVGRALTRIRGLYTGIRRGGYEYVRGSARRNGHPGLAGKREGQPRLSSNRFCMLRATYAASIEDAKV